MEMLGFSLENFTGELCSVCEEVKEYIRPCKGEESEFLWICDGCWKAIVKEKR